MTLFKACRYSLISAWFFCLSALPGCGSHSPNTDPAGPTSSASPVASSSHVTSPDSSSSGVGTSSSGTVNEAITALQAANEMGKGFNLGQTFDNTQQPRTFAAAKAKIDAYYAQGFRNLRIPITWTENVDGTTLVNDVAVGDVNRNHPRLLVISQVIDYALSLQDMYVVINAHHEKTLKNENRAAVLEHLWQDIADIYRNRNHRLLFEVLNEPHLNDNSAMPPENLRAMTRRAYKKIRAVDAQRIIIIGGNRWFAADEMAITWPHLDDVGKGQDQYLMATFHHYNPWTFHGENQGDYSDNWTDNDIVIPMDTMLSWSTTIGNGMPVYLGEWGTSWASRYETFSCNNIRLFYSKLDAQYASAKGIPTAVWDDGGWFKIFDFTTYTFTNNLSQCISGICEWDGSNRFNEGCF